MNVFLKLIGLNLKPLPLALGILICGLLILWTHRKDFLGKFLITVGVALILFFSMAPIPNALLNRLERQYGIFDEEALSKEPLKHIRYIVVLAGGHTYDPGISITDQFTYPGLVRIVEAIRIHRKLPESKLILSGGPGRSHITDAELMARLCEELGVNKNRIILESKSKSTIEEVRLVKPILEGQLFLLVTSADHMVRAMALFKKIGMNPIPVPTGHLIKNIDGSNSVFPDSWNLYLIDAFLRERLSLLKEYLAGNI